MKRFAAFIPVVLLLALVLASVVVLTRGGERQTVSAGHIGRAAPTFALTRLGGGELVTSDAFAGRAYVVNVFASWCAPCRVEHPQLMALQAQGVSILGIAYKDEPEDAARFLRGLGNPFEAAALDPQGRFALELGVAGAVPETFVIGADGRIRAVHRGPLTEDIIASDILPALAAP